MAVKRKIDLNKILKNIDYKASKGLQKKAFDVADAKANKLQKEALTAFNNHPVTQEIEQGSSGMNSSLLGGKGNFFGFLGFRQGQRPLQIIREAFTHHIKVNPRKGRLKKISSKVFTFEYEVNIPSPQEIYAVTPMPWSSRSWVKGVEKGINNYTKTIFRDSEKSRSGIALQSNRNIGFITFSPTPYISKLLEDLRRKLR